MSPDIATCPPRGGGVADMPSGLPALSPSGFQSWACPHHQNHMEDSLKTQISGAFPPTSTTTAPIQPAGERA